MKAIILKDSIHWQTRKRITTWELTYPRFIHAEFMTHRMFSRNAASSRAVPIEKMIAKVMEDPAMPVHWGRNQPGMQAREEVERVDEARHRWLVARDYAVAHAHTLADLGLHKQIVNRVLEPFLNITVICTATEWDDWYAQRVHPDAQPEIRALALGMRGALGRSKPQELTTGEWHIPFDEPGRHILDRLAIATGRCARVSYLTHDGKRDPEKDVGAVLEVTRFRPAALVTFRALRPSVARWRQLKRQLSRLVSVSKILWGLRRMDDQDEGYEDGYMAGIYRAAALMGVDVDTLFALERARNMVDVELPLQRWRAVKRG